MSRGRPDPPEEPPEPDEADEEDDEAVPELELVEYLLPPELLGSSRTSVPKSVQELHSSSSAPSTFVVVREACSAPHISHWGIRDANTAGRIKGTPIGGSCDAVTALSDNRIRIGSGIPTGRTGERRRPRHRNDGASDRTARGVT
jgi:hypothetical protein